MEIQPRHSAGLGSTLLLATDRSSSVLAEAGSGRVNRIAYSPYGNQTAGVAPRGRLGFNGELRDRPHGWYHLGNGHRVYNPVLRRFHSPDHLSPFAEGGLNPYAYCVGDPVNHVDPRGRDAMFLHVAAFIGFGVALVAGGVSALLPVLLKKAAASSAMASATYSAASGTVTTSVTQRVGSWLSTYAGLKPGVGMTPLGGLDGAATYLSILGAPVGAAGTIQSLVEDPSQMRSELMYIGASMALFAVPVKSLVVPLTPRLPTSTWGKRWAKLVHGRDKIAAARTEAVDAMRLADFDAAAARSAVGSAGGSSRPSVSSASSVSPAPSVSPGPSGPPVPPPRRKRLPMSDVHQPQAVLPEKNFTLRRGGYETLI